MDNLIEKLKISKAIMDKAENIKSTGQKHLVEDFQVPNATYNIPQEYQSAQPAGNLNRMTVNPTIDAIMSSKLPDEVKQLMIEHPIEKPQQQNVGITNELAERASRLMRDSRSEQFAEPQRSVNESVFKDVNELKVMIRESIKDILTDYGVIHESIDDTQENFNFKLGKHIFEGKITKIRKFK